MPLAATVERDVAGRSGGTPWELPDEWLVPGDISLAGRTLSLHVQDHDIRYGLSVRQSVSPRVQSGVIALGLAAPGKPARIIFRQVTVVTNARR